jgi:hypothetical protein
LECGAPKANRNRTSIVLRAIRLGVLAFSWETILNLQSLISKPKMDDKAMALLQLRATALLSLPIDWKPLIQTLVEDQRGDVEEYHRFLVMKTLKQDADIDQLQLSPSPRVDAVWHAHLLLPQNYFHVCGVFLGFGKVFEHSVLTADQKDQRERYGKTLALYEQLWSKPNEQVWPSLEQPRSTGSLDLFVRSTTGKTYTVNLPRDSSVADLFRRFHEKSGIPIDQIRLLFAGRELKPERTLEAYNLQRESTVHLVLPMRGC